MVPLRAPVDPRDTALWIAMPSRSAEVDPFTRHPGQLARDRVEAIRSPVPDALAETVRKIGGRFGIRNIRVRLPRAKDESIHSRHDGGLQFIGRRGPATPEGAGRRQGPPSIPGAVSARTRSDVRRADHANAARCPERPLCRLASLTILPHHHSPYLDERAARI